jgi:hypothetical protein
VAAGGEAVGENVDDPQLLVLLARTGSNRASELHDRSFESG